MQKKSIKAVIFDLDGTLSDTNAIYLKIYKKIFMDLGIKPGDSEIYRYYGLPSIEIIRNVTSRFYDKTVLKESDIKKMNRKLVEILSSYITRKNTISKEKIDTIKWIRGKGLKTAIGTGTVHAAAAEILRGNKAYFDVIITPEDVKKGKPAPDTFLLCAKKLKVRPEDCLVVGDTEKDIIAGKKAGMTTVGITSGITKKDVFERYGPYSVIERLPGIKEIIAGLLHL